MSSWESNTLLLPLAMLVAVCYGQGPPHKEGVSSRGTEFLLSFGPQELSTPLSGKNRLYVSSYQATEVQLRMPSEPVKKYRVDRGKMTVIELPAQVRGDSTLGEGGKKERNGILLKSGAPVSVYALQMKAKSARQDERASEGYLGLPTAFLGTSYVVAGIVPSSSSFIQVVARHDATNVWFHLHMVDDHGNRGSLVYGEITYRSGDKLKVQLDQLESFLLMSWYDFTGTIVSSDKPVSVLSGCDCTHIPASMVHCNHLVEQMPPFSHLGGRFVVHPVNGQNAGMIYRVIAAYNQTAVRVKGSHATVLEEGKYHEINDTSLFDISTSRPSLVVQYTSALKSVYGPMMTIIPSVAQWTNDYLIEAPKSLSGRYFDATLNVAIATRHRDGLRVKSESSLTDRFNWSDIVSAQMSTTSVRLHSRFYHVFHTSPLVKFMAVLYGEAASETIESFGFPVGVAGVTNIGGICSPTGAAPGDGVDNDCDGRIDEEVFNGADDDSDGRLDEDLAVPKPITSFPPNKTVSNCDSGASSTSSTGKASGTALHQCQSRGRINVTHTDVVFNQTRCSHNIERRWVVQDECGNVVRRNQYIRVSTPVLPLVKTPPDVILTCRDPIYLTEGYTGSARTSQEVCPGTNREIVDSLTGSCPQKEAKLHRTWIIKQECKEKRQRQTITLLPLSSIRLLKNYVAILTFDDEVFVTELENRESPAFKKLTLRIQGVLKKRIFSSRNGGRFVGAEVLDFRNGSVEAHVRLRFGNSSNITLNAVVDTLTQLYEEQGLCISNIQVQDFDECLKPEDNECDRNANCSNIPDSYRCTCHQGFVGDGIICQAPPRVTVISRVKEVAPDKNITLRCQADGVPPPVFTWTTPDGTEVTLNNSVELSAAADDSDVTLTRGKAVQKGGSLLIYGTTDNDAGLYKCEAKNSLGSDSGVVNLTIRVDYVQVDVVITLVEQTFTEELEDTTSPKYKALEKTVKDELTTQFQNVTGFERVEILGFSNGSVKVEFRVVIKVDEKKKNPKVQAKVVAETLKVKVESGSLGNLKVKPKMELKEIPPPPVDINYSNLKKDAVRIGWDSPDLSELYSISGYSLQHRMFGDKKWDVYTVKGKSRRVSGLEPGKAYVFRLKTNNPYGSSEPSQQVEFKTPKEESPVKLVLAIVLPLIFLVILAVVGFFVYKKWQKRTKDGYATAETDSHLEMHETLAAPHDRYAVVAGSSESPAAAAPTVPSSFTGRRIKRDCITLGKMLGEGEFGTVTRAELAEDDGRTVPCAVKTLKRNATESDFKDLLNELEIMQAAGKHRNIVNLIGACVEDGPLMVVVELAANGPLLRYLRNHRTQNYDNMNEYTLDIPLQERLRIAIGVANGMAHLSKVKCVHRDLAARNVLLDEEMVAKVSDFGLSRDIYTDNVYQKQTGGKLPAKWMAIESLECGTYTSQSDVWSFGVLLWEIETGGCAPYAGLSARALLEELKNGHRLEKPRYCSNELYSVMRLCWNPNPSQRPTFEQLSEELAQPSHSEQEYVIPDPEQQPLYANVRV